VVARARAGLHRALPGGDQHPDGLPVTTPAGLGQVLPAECLAAARTASRSSVLAPPGARRAGGPVDLCHPLALLEQVGGEPSPVAAGALDRPHPAPWGLLDRESVDAQVAGGVGGTVWCAMAAPVGFTTAAVWVALWVSTPMMWSMVSASMGDAAFVAGWRRRRRPGEGDRVAGL
jgi:hypothetical protein